MRRLDTDVYSLTAAARADNGAARLDEMFGRQWAGWVNPERLNMEDMKDDILGQLYGSFVAGKLASKFNRHMCEVYGFQALRYLDKTMEEADIAGLTEEWRKQIYERTGTGSERNSSRVSRLNYACHSGVKDSESQATSDNLLPCLNSTTPTSGPEDK